MANNHSSVAYVEPNDIFSFTDEVSTDKRFHSKMPPLEDFCTAMNIEVEVSSRENNVSVQGDKEVIVLAWRNENNKSTVNFMSGKKYSNGTRYLSTDWADMYTSDLIDHGTTEMLGIKSVNVEYNKTCIPVITVQFTDVRGMSLFQPKGLANDAYARSLSGKDIAQSFFECFFKIPYPIFTIYLKGFYGEPVAYEVMCDKFDTNFNADNGSFDVTVRFIGYWFSFLTDISYLALLSSPYSDYRGQEYWDSQVKSGRFLIPNRDGTENVPMPRMFEMWANWRKLIATANGDLLDDVTEGEIENHDLEINSLNEIRRMAQSWYKSLEAVVQNKYGKERCVILKNGDDYEGILVLTTVDSPSDMYDDFSQFPSDFMRLNGDLYSAIEQYNASNKSYSAIKNVSFDFSDYKRKKILNYVYIDKNNGDVLTFGGVNGECPIDRAKIVEEVNNYNSLKVIFNDGTDEYVDGYYIDFDYSNIGDRINKLIEDSEENEENKKKAKLKEQNRIMFSKMNWFPSVENFTKIVMAHLETFMAMMWDTAQNVKGRTINDLKISATNLGDVPSGSKTVPPFPRVTKEVKGSDGISKMEDTWIGEFNKGKGFFEINIVNGLLNAVDLIKKLQEENDAEIEAIIESTRRTNSVKSVPMKYPLTSYDFYLTENPYGDKKDIKSNIAALFGKVAMRMFGILSLNALRGEYDKQWLSDNTIRTLARLEAENFITYIGDLDKNVMDALGPNGCINAENAMKVVMGDADTAKKYGLIGEDGLFPWDLGSDVKKGTPLFSNATDYGTTTWLSRFAINEERFIYPIQRLSYDRIDREVRILKDGKEDFKDGSFMTSDIGESSDWKDDYLFGDYRSAYNDYYIDDDYTFVQTVAENSAAERPTVEGDSDTQESQPNDYKYIATLMGFGGNKVSPSEDYALFFANVDLNDRDAISKACERETNKDEFYKKGWSYDRFFEIYKIESLDANELISEIEANTFNKSCFLRTYGLYKDADGESYNVNPSHDFFTSLSLGEYTIPHFDKGHHSEVLDGKYMETAAFLLSLNRKGSSFKLLKNIEAAKKTFARVPKLAILQCGAVLAVHYASSEDGTLYKDVDREFISKELNCNDADMMSFLNGMSTLGKYTVLNYFIKWTDKWHKEIFKNLSYDIMLDGNQGFNGAVINFSNQEAYYNVLMSDMDRSICIGLLNVENNFVKSLTNDLFSCVSLTCASVSHYKNLMSVDRKIEEYGYGKFEVSQGQIFLDEFFNVVRDALYKEDKEDEQTKIAEEPKNTTDDMRSELYRYLKQVYDKWLPSSTMEDWKYEKFFEEAKHTEGRTFRFIDSYYNKIGQKLLVNPQKVVDMIGDSLSASEVNYMLFNFLADVYAQSKCMLMCVQNFIDLSEKKSMENMFKPIPYNKMKRPRKHPDFVVVYPHEPSKHLSLDNHNYEDDSFMLNNEMETPLAIRSRGEGEGERWYKIPAFGVSYGRQYQSVFKGVNVSMANAVMTEQAILAKHAILRGATNTNTKGIASQDLYSIYANQSYTCKVEMMGCMWAQPMMYMVLLNIPMFRGSYMIMSVKHSMVPGNMTTEITAVRMANMSNHIVEDIFTEEFAKDERPKIPSPTSRDGEKIKSECEYHVYPLFSSNNTIDLTSELNRKVTRDDCFSDAEYNVLKNDTILTALAKIAQNEGGTAVPLQYMLVATVLYNRRLKYGGYKQYIFHHPQFDIKKLTGVTPTTSVTSAVKEIFTNSPTCILTKYSKTDVGREVLKSYSDSIYFKKGNTIKGSTIDTKKLSQILYFGNYQEYAKGTNKWVLEQPIVMAQDASSNGAYGHCFNGEYDGKGSLDCVCVWDASIKNKNSYSENTVDEEKSSKEGKNRRQELNDAFFTAVQKSINSSAKLACELGYRVDVDNVMHITQKDGKNDHLAYAYDIILNSYYNYISELYWIFSNSQSEEDPIEVCVKVIESQTDVNRKIWLAQIDATTKMVSKDAKNLKFNANDKFSTMFAYAVKKRYGSNIESKYASKEMSQIVDFNGIKSADVSKCDAVGEAFGNGFFIDDTLVGDNPTVVGKFNISKALLWINNNSYDQYIKGKCGKCATAVLKALAAGGLTLPNGERHSCGEKSGSGYATNLWYDDLLKDWGFSMVSSGQTTAQNRVFPQKSALQKGDVAIIGFNKNKSQFSSENYRYHACMWDGKQWISDFKQGEKMSPYGEISLKNISERYYPYAVFRYTKRD